MVSEAYCAPDVVKALGKAFRVDGFVQLDCFLPDETYLRLAKHAWGKGTRSILADQHSYSLVSPASFQNVFGWKEMHEWLGNVLGIRARKISLSVRQFSHRDFTLVHDVQEHGVAQFFFIFSGRWDAEWGGTLTVNRGEVPALEVGLKGNRLFVMRSCAEWLPFVQYVNHLAGKERFVIVQGTIS
jgi:hypothetical protein